jgi:site-specific DNA recombinase
VSRQSKRTSARVLMDEDGRVGQVKDVPRPAVKYLRVSSAEQEKEGYSIPAQEKLVDNYALAHSISVVARFVDVETAKRAGRKHFNRMLDFLRANPAIRVVLVEKTDRLYRNFRDYVTIDDLGIEVHLIKEGEIISKESRSHQKFIHGIKVLMAKNFIDNLSEEVKKGMGEKAAAGEFPHRAPPGYLNDRVSKTIVVDPDRAPYVRKMFEWYATGRFSIDDIHDRCLQDGFTAHPGSTTPLARSKVEYILKNPFYVGLFRWKGQVYPGRHEAIVSQELWDRVQAAFRSHGRRRGKYRVHDFAFGGLITCGVCGCAVTAQIKKGRYVYYRCTNFRGDCSEGYYREEVLADQFADIVGSIHLDREVADWIKGALKQTLARETAHHREAVSRLTRELDQVKRRMNQAYLDKLDGRITEEFWAERAAEWQAEKARITEQLARHQGGGDDGWLDAGAQMLDLAGQARDLYLRQDAANRRRLLGFVLADCMLHDGRLTPTYRPPFDIMARMATEAARRLPKPGRSCKIGSWGG